MRSITNVPDVNRRTKTMCNQEESHTLNRSASAKAMETADHLPIRQWWNKEILMYHTPRSRPNSSQERPRVLLLAVRFSLQELVTLLHTRAHTSPAANIL